MTDSLQIILLIWVYSVGYLVFSRLLLRRIKTHHRVLAERIVGSGLFAEIATSWNVSRIIISRGYTDVDDAKIALFGDIAFVLLCLYPLVVLGSIYLVLA